MVTLNDNRIRWRPATEAGRYLTILEYLEWSILPQWPSLRFMILSVTGGGFVDSLLGTALSCFFCPTDKLFPPPPPPSMIYETGLAFISEDREIARGGGPTK
jgi:hypothetical protein